jgi:GT2 family glycosyltransferase
VTRVSVVTPFLDAEAHLREAIDSVRAQTVADWELLLVDDGSTDASASIAAAAAAGDARIRLLTRPPGAAGGAAAARNLGIAAAAGAFVAFLDADDVLEPDMLAATLAAFDRNPNAAMVFGPTLWWHPGGGGDWLESTYRRAGRIHRAPTLLRSLILLQKGQVPCTCSVLVRKAALEAVGGFDVRFRLYEDQTLWVKLFRSYDVYITPERLSRYRQHPGSVSAGAAAAGEYDRMRAHSARRDFLAWVEGYLLSTGGSDPGLLRALRLSQSPYRAGNVTTWLDQRALALHRWGWRTRCRMWQLIYRLRPPNPLHVFRQSDASVDRR